MPRKLIIDCDPGVDDTLALLLALHSPELEVVGLTTVFGNGPVAVTTENARRVLETAGRAELPVAAGAARPLVRPPRAAPTHVHGHDAFGDAGWPAPRTGPVRTSAASFIVEAVLAQPGEITVLAVGPLTNLALALALEPGAAQAVEGVVVMGGAVTVPGNVSPVAEANFHSDPEAADAVLAADWPVTVVGMDVTTRTILSDDFITRLGQGGQPMHELIRRVFPVYQAYYHQRYGLAGGTFVHDPSAAAYLLEPGLFTTEQSALYVETQGRCVGQVVADQRSLWGERRVQQFCVGVESERLLGLIAARLLPEA